MDQFDESKYMIPGGMLCKVCGLTYYRMSMGGPGICPSCDCGNSGPQILQAQKLEIDRLRKLLAERVTDSASGCEEQK